MQAKSGDMTVGVRRGDVVARRDQAFWQKAHGALFGLAGQMTAGQVADTLLAVATAQLCPVNLLEGLQDQLRRLRGELEADEAITCAWALCSMQLLSEGLHPELLERAVGGELAGKQAGQLRQVALTMELEPAALRAREALPERLRARLRERADAGAEHGQGDEGVAEELAELLGESGAGLALSEQVGGFYVVDLAVRPREGPPIAVLLDGALRGRWPTTCTGAWPGRPCPTGSGSVRARRSPLAEPGGRRPPTAGPGLAWRSAAVQVLKCRHLRRLGWAVAWLPAPRWRFGSDEDQRGIAAALLSELNSHARPVAFRVPWCRSLRAGGSRAPKGRQRAWAGPLRQPAMAPQPRPAGPTSGGGPAFGLLPAALVGVAAAKLATGDLWGGLGLVLLLLLGSCSPATGSEQCSFLLARGYSLLAVAVAFRDVLLGMRFLHTPNTGSTAEGPSWPRCCPTPSRPCCCCRPWAATTGR
ncbi:unnamed protein product [Prorocentrum cordatum]|uniref:Uncharacterized protein n=1 Tax=Prorocentrum cordatum TaxID=2364126 RepID=A0ABN9XZP1_9DINO|nr:unnamed protein product [Polarella glacialis]